MCSLPRKGQDNATFVFRVHYSSKSVVSMLQVGRYCVHTTQGRAVSLRELPFRRVEFKAKPDLERYVGGSGVCKHI